MEWCWRLVSLPSAPISSVCSFPNSCTQSCSLLSGALYCFIASTGYGTFLPFILQPLSTKLEPRVIWDRGLTMISSYCWQTFPEPMNCPPNTNPDPSGSPYPPWIHSESMCVTDMCRKPSHKTWEQNDANTGLFLFEPLWNPSPHMLPWVKWLKHSQKGGSHLSCNTWMYSFFNTTVHTTLLNIKNTGLEKASWNHLHHSLLKQGKHYLDTKGISPDCSIFLPQKVFLLLKSFTSSVITKKVWLAAFFHCIFSSIWNPTWFHIDEITDMSFFFMPHFTQILKGYLSFLFCSHARRAVSYVLKSQMWEQLNCFSTI